MVQTRSNNPIQQNGDITVDVPVNASLNAGQNATLNLDAQGNISFTTNGSITHGGGTLNVNHNAGIDATFTTPGTNPGSITMAAGSLITTGGGSVTATAHTLGIALAGINTGAGALTVNSNGGWRIAQNSAITVNGRASFYRRRKSDKSIKFYKHLWWDGQPNDRCEQCLGSGKLAQLRSFHHRRQPHS